MMLLILVQVIVKREMLAEFERAILTNAEAARATEDGCVRFDVSQQDDDPAQWMFYEAYKDAAGLKAHRESAHFLAYQAVAERAVIAKTVTRYTIKRLSL